MPPRVSFSLPGCHLALVLVLTCCGCETSGNNRLSDVPAVGGDGACDGCGTSDGGPTGASCSTVCAHLSAAMCSAFEPMCEVNCTTNDGRSPPGCDPSLQAYKNCQTTATVVCDAAGRPTTPSCSAQGTAYGSCVANPPPVAANPQPPSAATCDGACARTNATCPRADAMCVSGCNDATAMASARCSAEFRAVLACVANATVTCSSSGRARVNGCDAQNMALSQCMNP